MGTTTEELKKLYAKLGGEEDVVRKASTPGEVLNGINELDLGGGGDIPAGSITKDKLSEGVQASLDKADTAAQPADIPNIEANPDGEATEVLSTIKIGNVIYSVPSGGGIPSLARSYVSTSISQEG